MSEAVQIDLEKMNQRQAEYEAHRAAVRQQTEAHEAERIRRHGK